jgi:AraC-like DNA-binding protein
MSRQTLYRKLRAEGTSFEAVRDDLRRRRALDYLGKDRMSVAEAAHALGFSDRAAFSRACKRWTGIGPAALRDRRPGSNGEVRR